MPFCPSTPARFALIASALVCALTIIPRAAAQAPAGYVCTQLNSSGKCTEYKARNSLDPTLPYAGQPAFPTNAYPGMPTQTTTNPWGTAFSGVVYPVQIPPQMYQPTTQQQYVVPPQYQRCANPYRDCQGTVTVRARADRNAVPRGETVRFLLYLRNEDVQSRTVNLKAFLDEEMTFVAASSKGYSQGASVLWEPMTIPANGARTVSLQVRVRSNSPLGRQLRLTVQAGSSADSAYVSVGDRPYDGIPYRIYDDTYYSPYGVPVGPSYTNRDVEHFGDYETVKGNYYWRDPQARARNRSICTRDRDGYMYCY